MLLSFAETCFLYPWWSPKFSTNSPRLNLSALFLGPSDPFYVASFPLELPKTTTKDICLGTKVASSRTQMVDLVRSQAKKATDSLIKKQMCGRERIRRWTNNLNKKGRCRQESTKHGAAFLRSLRHSRVNHLGNGSHALRFLSRWHRILGPSNRFLLTLQDTAICIQDNFSEGFLHGLLQAPTVNNKSAAIMHATLVYAMPTLIGEDSEQECVEQHFTDGLLHPMLRKGLLLPPPNSNEQSLRLSKRKRRGEAKRKKKGKKERERDRARAREGTLLQIIDSSTFSIFCCASFHTRFHTFLSNTRTHIQRVLFSAVSMMLFKRPMQVSFFFLKI